MANKHTSSRTIDLETVEDKKTRRKKYAIITAIIFAAVLAGYILYSATNWQNYFAADENESEKKIAQLELQISNLQNQVNQFSQTEKTLRAEIKNLASEQPKQQIIVQVEGEKNAALLALLNLQTAISRGQKFTQQLQVAKFLIKNESLNQLDPHASSGIVTLENLITEFKKATTANSKPLTINSSNIIFQQLASYISVRNRPTKNSKTKAINQALQQAELTQVLTLWETLTAEEKLPLMEWQKKLALKNKIDKILSQLISEFTSGS